LTKFYDAEGNEITEEEYHELMHQELLEKGFMYRDGFPGETLYGRKVIRYYWRDG
jgi:hypothetical protein